VCFIPVRKNTEDIFRISAKIVLFYAVLAGAWILFSDNIIGMLSSSQKQLMIMQTYKGMGFVIVTSVLLFLYIFNEIKNRSEKEEEFKEVLKSSKKALESSRLTLSAAFQAMPQMIFISDMNDGTIVEMNEKMARKFGIEPGYMKDLSISSIRGLENLKDLHKKMIHSISSIDLDDFETDISNNDGSRMDVSVWSREISREGERKILWIVQDVTSEKRAGQKTRNALLGVVSAMGRIFEKRDPYTQGHQERVAFLASAIAREMGLSDIDVEGIKISGYIHDVGKIIIPAEILSKPGRLTDIEYRMIKLHPETGSDFLSDIDFPWPVQKMMYQHHERIDGSGYPEGLSGNDIVMGARILAVADIVEAMSSHRPYRPGLGIDAALKEIRDQSGISLDRDVVDACLDLFKKDQFFFEQFADHKTVMVN